MQLTRFFASIAVIAVVVSGCGEPGPLVQKSSVIETPSTTVAPTSPTMETSTTTVAPTTTTTAKVTTTTAKPVTTTTRPAVTNSSCDPHYPGVCIPPPPPDLDCGEISHKNFAVVRGDPHGFDADKDGIGCEKN